MSTNLEAGRAPVRQGFLDALRLVREALAGREYVFTSGPIGRAVILLAIPMVLELAMESVFILVDIFWVSRLGSDAIAAVGLTEAVLTLLYAIAIGLSMGTTALVARRIGEGDERAARSVAAQTIWLALAASVVIGAVGIVAAEDVLRMMGASDGVVANGGSRYTRIMLGGSSTILFIFMLNAIFRGAGNAVIAMRALWIANGINLALDPLLIFGTGPFPELGVAGAAVATNTGRAVGVAYQLACLYRGRAEITVGPRDLGFDLGLMLRLLRVSVGGVLQFLIATSSFLLLMRIVARYGSEAVAGFTVAIRLIEFTFLPAWGLGNAAATLMGQNLGAGRPDRAAASAWRAATYNAVFLTGVGIVFIAFAAPLTAVFTSEPAVARYSVDCLRYIGYAYGLYGIGMVITQSFNGAGDTDTPTLINFFCLWLLQIPLAWLLAEPYDLGPRGIFLGMAISEAVMAAVAVWIFRLGRWKTKQV